MTPEQKAAYIQSQSVAAMAEVMGMQAENQQRELLGHSMAYTHEDFVAVIERYGIHHNAVISFFRGD